MADQASTGTRRATNVSLPAELIDEARALGVGISQACTTGLKAEVKKAREAKWLEENRASIEYWNEYVERNGLPLAKYRQF